MKQFTYFIKNCFRESYSNMESYDHKFEFSSQSDITNCNKIFKNIFNDDFISQNCIGLTKDENEDINNKLTEDILNEFSQLMTFIDHLKLKSYSKLIKRMDTIQKDLKLNQETKSDLSKTNRNSTSMDEHDSIQNENPNNIQLHNFIASKEYKYIKPEENSNKISREDVKRLCGDRDQIEEKDNSLEGSSAMERHMNQHMWCYLNLYSTGAIIETDIHQQFNPDQTIFDPLQVFLSEYATEIDHNLKNLVSVHSLHQENTDNITYDRIYKFSKQRYHVYENNFIFQNMFSISNSKCVKRKNYLQNIFQSDNCDIMLKHYDFLDFRKIYHEKQLNSPQLQAVQQQNGPFLQPKQSDFIQTNMIKNHVQYSQHIFSRLKKTLTTQPAFESDDIYLNPLKTTNLQFKSYEKYILTDPDFYNVESFKFENEKNLEYSYANVIEYHSSVFDPYLDEEIQLQMDKFKYNIDAEVPKTYFNTNWQYRNLFQFSFFHKLESSPWDDNYLQNLVQDEGYLKDFQGSSWKDYKKLETDFKFDKYHDNTKNNIHKKMSGMKLNSVFNACNNNGYSICMQSQMMQQKFIKQFRYKYYQDPIISTQTNELFKYSNRQGNNLKKITQELPINFKNKMKNKYQNFQFQNQISFIRPIIDTKLINLIDLNKKLSFDYSNQCNTNVFFKKLTNQKCQLQPLNLKLFELQIEYRNYIKKKSVQLKEDQFNNNDSIEFMLKNVISPWLNSMFRKNKEFLTSQDFVDITEQRQVQTNVLKQAFDLELTNIKSGDIGYEQACIQSNSLENFGGKTIMKIQTFEDIAKQMKNYQCILDSLKISNDPDQIGLDSEKKNLLEDSLLKLYLTSIFSSLWDQQKGIVVNHNIPHNSLQFKTPAHTTDDIMGRILDQKNPINLKNGYDQMGYNRAHILGLEFKLREEIICIFTQLFGYKVKYIDQDEI